MTEKSMNAKIITSLLVSIVVATVLAGCVSTQAQEPQGPPPPAVSVAPVSARDVTPWDEFSGRIEAPQTVDIRPRVSGYIDKVAYREGQEVKKGDVLFVIDQRPYRAELDRAQAAL